MTDLWKGLSDKAGKQLTRRDYSARSLADRLATSGVEAGELVHADRSKRELAARWIPGVEIFARKIFPQRHRGFFGEFARQEEGVLAEIGMWPRQWATARMFANTAKGFHVHPPHVPKGEQPGKWFRRLYVERPRDFSLRPYAKEQWDVMFVIQGVAEFFFIDERAGMERRLMRFLIEGDDHRGPSNVGVVIPPGVAHAIRAEGSTDVIMVYGTSMKFDPAAEGRIASGIETATLPPEWERYIRSR
jgi:dTDP-4-dehydrorhamnose 3,5-epimerase-like enzyme